MRSSSAWLHPRGPRSVGPASPLPGERQQQFPRLPVERQAEAGQGRVRNNAAVAVKSGRAAQLPARAEAGPVGSGRGDGLGRIVRVPAEWWDAPPVVALSLSPSPRSAAAARRLARDTLREWELPLFADDAAAIVGELFANAVVHGTRPGGDKPGRLESVGLRLRRCAGGVVCAVLDPSGAVPVLKAPGSAAESGRGLQMVDALSDDWGWSPVPGRGKAVWAALFTTHGQATVRP